MAASDSKSTSFDPTKVSAPPVSVIILTIISFSVAIPMIALSVVNYGMLSIWLNSTIAVLTICYHLVFLIVVLIYRRRFSSADALIEHHEEEDESESFDDVYQMPSEPPSIAFNKWSIVVLTFLFLANLIAFCIMVDITALGAERSTLPAERLGSHKWNIKVQKAQTTVLGCQALSLGILLAISAWGRRCIVVEEESKSHHVEYLV
jgi:hypothetical protein